MDAAEIDLVCDDFHFNKLHDSTHHYYRENALRFYRCRDGS